MPRTHFLKQANKLEPGLAGIFILKTQYDTSIECTTKHYVNQNISATIMIRWTIYDTFHYAWCSKSFTDMTGLKNFHLPIRVDSDYIKGQVAIIDSSGSDYVETATPLSRWFSTIMQGASNNLIGLEQTVKLGDFGGITLLTFQN